MDKSVALAAAEAFRGKQYHLALNLYSELGEKIGLRNVQGSLSVCRSRLDYEWPMYFSSMGYESLIDLLGFGDAKNLIYADIDLNTVDGSAIWMSSMASILAENGKTIVISKNKIRRNVIVDNLIKKKNIIILTPENVSSEVDSLDVSACVGLIRKLDDILGGLRCVIVRGGQAAKELVDDRRFYKRLYVYLTDFYQHDSDGLIKIKNDVEYVDVLARQSQAFLVQTPAIERKLRTLTSFPFKSFQLPPPVFGFDSGSFVPGRKLGEEISIGYAGKIAPNWGVEELVEWVEKLREDGFRVKLVIIGDKISGAGNAEDNKKYRAKINSLLKRVDAVRLGALDRAATLREMEAVDFSWCWRPPIFEKNTLELSTKLIEGVVAGQVCLTYPSDINIDALGEKYPFYIRNYSEFKGLVSKKEIKIDLGVVEKLKEKHSIFNIAKRFEECFGLRRESHEGEAKICLASHDSKFVFPYYSYLKNKGVPIKIDEWGWGEPLDENRSSNLSESSDIVFCEWGLANSVWYSKNIPDGKKLVVRIHLQEINQRAAKFGREVNKDRVDLFVFVSDRVRNEAIKMFGFKREKTVVIPNFVLDDEYRLERKNFDDVVRLGMVGIIPQRKRFDLAVSLLESLCKQGVNAILKIKGPRPEEIPWMRVGGRAKELEYYYQVYEKIENSPLIKGKVYFEGWGNNVAQFYSQVDYILSPSDFESFHYALADGVVSGCYPIVWSWDEAGDLYTPDWLVSDVSGAVEKILNFRKLNVEERKRQVDWNRDLVIGKYGMGNIFKKLDSAVIAK